MVEKMPKAIDIQDVARYTFLLMNHLDLNRNEKVEYNELPKLDVNQDGFFEESDLVEYFEKYGSNVKSLEEWCFFLNASECQKIKYLMQNQYKEDELEQVIVRPIFLQVNRDLSRFKLFRKIFNGLPPNRNFPSTRIYADGALKRWSIFSEVLKHLKTRKSWTPDQIIDLNYRLSENDVDLKMMEALKKIVKWTRYKKYSKVSIDQLEYALSRIFNITAKQIAALNIVAVSLSEFFDTYGNTGAVNKQLKEKILINAKSADSILHDHLEVVFRGIEGISFRGPLTKKDLERQFNAIKDLLTKRLAEIGYEASLNIKHFQAGSLLRATLNR